MPETLLSVGLDVGTTSTQMILSAITVENRASGFAVPEMAITDRKVLYKSPVHFTPLKSHSLVDSNGLRQLVEGEYRAAGIRREQVDTGAVIITGETSRKENAGAVLQALSSFAGDFVVATAGPDLESVLAAKGSGAAEYSQKTGKTVLHMDIGGGTSNLALIEDGRVVRTGCLNVGGRLLKFSESGELLYVSPVLKDLCQLAVGDRPTGEQTQQVAELLCRALEMAAGRKAPTELLQKLSTDEVQAPWLPPDTPVTVSFSGGVADCIEKDIPSRAFGDIGPELGQAIRGSSLCRQDYILGSETIRATVIGAGCHSTQLSGSTVFCRNTELPKKNLPVLSFSRQEQDAPDFPKRIAGKIASSDAPEVILAMPGYEDPDYQKVSALAEAIRAGVGDRPVYVCLQQDMAKALGQRLGLMLPEGRPCICLDRLHFAPESYLDIGAPVGPCYPVVIKTLVLAGK